MKPVIRTLLAAVFCLVLVILPWFFGSVLPGTRSALLLWVTLGTLICVFAPSSVGTPTRLETTFKSLLLAGIGWAAIQLIPFAGSTISQYPAATKAQLALLIMAVGIFFLSNCIFSDKQKLNWLFGAIALNGVLITWLGLAQMVSGTEQMFWTYELVSGGEMFGPYVNSNNAGGYLLMCFAAANFFLALIGFRSVSRTAGPRGGDDSALQRVFSMIGRAIAKANTWELYTLLAVTVTAAGVFATTSRGAAVALIVAVFVGWGLLFRKNLAFAMVAAIVVLGSVGLLGWAQRNETIATNFESLSNSATYETKLAHWQDGWNYAVDYLPFGSGLGTYNLMYLPYQKRPFLRWFKYAENQYLQTFAELGLPGLLILLALLMLAGWACLRLLSKPDQTSKALGLAGIMALLSQGVAAAFDFGLYQAANTYLRAAIVGAIFGQLNWCWSASNVTAAAPRKQIRFAQLMMLVMALSSAWATVEYSAVDAREACRRFYRQFDPLSDDRNSIPFYRQLANYSATIRNDDAQSHYQLALTHVLDYRIAASEAMVAEMLLFEEESAADNQAVANDAEQVDTPEFTLEQAWPRSNLTSLHRLSRIAKHESPEFFKSLQESPPVHQHLKPAWNEMLLAEAACDKFWNIPIGLGQLTPLMDETLPSQQAIDAAEQEYIDGAVERSRNNPDALLIAGMVKHHSGHTEEACELWKNCLSQTTEFELPIFQICLSEISLKDFLEKVLPDDPEFRLRVAKKYFGSKENLLVRKILLDHTRSKVLSAEISEANKQFFLGEIARFAEDYPSAIQHLEQALKIDRHKVLWRVQLARALIAAKRYDQALTELKICEFNQGNHLIQCRRLAKTAKRRRKAEISGQPWSSEIQSN